MLKGLLTEGFFWIPSLAGPTTIASRQNGSGISWLFPFVVSVLVSNLTTLLSFSRIYNNFFELYNICQSHIAIWFTSSITIDHSIIIEYNFSSDKCFHVYPLQIFYVLLTMTVVPFCFKLIHLAVACIRYLIITYLESCGMNFRYWLILFSQDGHPPLGWSDTLAYLVLPVLLVLSQYISVQIMQSSQVSHYPGVIGVITFKHN